jgi:prepilin-type N-terminal cleavage/methylation domain-containing protein
MDSRGFTLIEIMMALVILTFAILGLATSTSGFMHVVTVGQERSTAIQLAQQRLERIQMDPNYAALDTAYAGTELSASGLTGYTRITEIVHTGSATDTVDYKTITVSVVDPSAADTIRRTIIVAAP